MNKPPISKVLKILELKERASEIYEYIDLLIEELREDHGSGIRFDYDLEDLPMMELNLHLFAYQQKQKGQFMKFEIIDNMDKFFNNEPIFKTTSISRFTFSSGSLKNKPKSLKSPQKPTEENYCENCMGNGWVNKPPFKGSETIVQSDCNNCNGTGVDPSLILIYG